MLSSMGLFLEIFGSLEYLMLSLCYQIKNMTKTHTLIVRGVTKDQKNALKRIARKGNVKMSVNQVMLSMIGTQTASEIEEVKKKPN